MAAPDTRFIPVAEQTVLIGRVASWVLSQGIEQLGRLKMIWPHIRLGVNVSARELLASSNLVERVMAELQAQRLPMDRPSLNPLDPAIQMAASRRRFLLTGGATR